RGSLIGKAAVVTNHAPAFVQHLKSGALPQADPEMRTDAVAPELRAEHLHKLSRRLALQPVQRTLFQAALDMLVAHTNGAAHGFQWASELDQCIAFVL